MAPTNGRSQEQVKRDISEQRDQLASAVASLRTELRSAGDLGAKLSAALPVAAAGALTVGFVLAGGIGATVRLAMRRGREGSTKARLGRFRLVDDD